MSKDKRGKRILVTSTDLMMIQFLVPHVINLSENGFEVEIACSDVGGRMKEIREKLKKYVKAIHVVRLVRSPASPTNLKGYRDMKKVIDAGHYDIIWTNEPVMGVATRLAARKARKNGTKVVYMTHGFHFFKGGSWKHWLAFYPVETFMSYITDMIVTINKEDFERAESMHARKVKYIHGIGVNTERLHVSENRCDIRKKLEIDEDSFIVLSVGELNGNKNHQVIIKAIGLLKDKGIHYIICGKGDEFDHLKQLAQEKEINNRVHFLGYRTDVVDICCQADIFAFPSHREGLGLASLEAMYCGLPLVTSNVRGPSDYMENGMSGFLCHPDDEKGFAKAIKTLKKHPELREKCRKNNLQTVVPYCLENVKEEVLSLFKEL